MTPRTWQEKKWRAQEARAATDRQLYAAEREPSKAELRRELEEAAANTAREQERHRQ